MSFAVIPLWMTIALPIGAFVAVNWVFHRILTDRELTVMQAIGLSPMQVARAPIALGALVSVAMLANSIFILPSSFGVYKEQQFKIRNNIPAILLQDNVFVDVVDGMTMLIGKHGSNGVTSDVFIHDTRNEGKIVTFLAETGQFINTNGALALVLQNGQRAELKDDTNNSAMPPKSATVTPCSASWPCTAWRITAMATSDADGTPATPMLVSSATTTMKNCWATDSSTPKAWQMNIAATHSYSAVPSMLTVAPSGSTKLAVRFDTPARCSTHSMVNGSVAELDAVENAVVSAGIIAL